MKTCLILIDIQNDYFSKGAMPLVDITTAAQNAQRLLQAFRKRRAEIVHVQHHSLHPKATFLLADTKGAEIYDRVKPLVNETVVTKHYPNGFRDSTLKDVLEGNGITHLIFCGAMSHMCIDTTVRAAFDLGFTCTVALDACATRDLQFNGKTIPATDVHDAFMAALSGTFASVLTTQQILDASD